MNWNPGLGLFSRLPYELREQIWLEFLPVGRDRKLEKCRYPKTLLDILRTSRDLYDEISDCLYSNSCLQFDVSPFYLQDPLAWIKIYFNKINRRRGRTIENKAMWRLLGRKNARRRGFYDLRLHSNIEAIEVNLLAPDPEDSGQLFWLWRRVTRFVEMLKEIPSLSHLTIRLQKCETQDWCSSTAVNSSIENRHGKQQYDYDVVILPFYSLQNTNSIKIETHSEELKSMMDWNMIDWASEVFSKRNTKNLYVAENVDQVITSPERDLDRRIASDHFWIYRELFSTCEGKTANFVRLVWLSNWFIYGESGRSEFEERIIYIINTYPEIVHQYDRDLKTLSSMHRVMTVLNHAAMFMQDEYSDWKWPEWQPGVWFREFKDGIPSWAFLEPDDGLGDLLLLNMEFYFNYIRHGGFFSRFPRAIEEWRSRHAVS